MGVDGGGCWVEAAGPGCCWAWERRSGDTWPAPSLVASSGEYVSKARIRTRTPERCSAGIGMAARSRAVAMGLPWEPLEELTGPCPIDGCPLVVMPGWEGPKVIWSDSRSTARASLISAALARASCLEKCPGVGPVSGVEEDLYRIPWSARALGWAARSRAAPLPAV